MSHTPLSEDELTLNSLTIALPTHGYATTTRHYCLEEDRSGATTKMDPHTDPDPVGELPREVTPITTLT
jgi:hypothetical protein